MDPGGFEFKVCQSEDDEILMVLRGQVSGVLRFATHDDLASFVEKYFEHAQVPVEDRCLRSDPADDRSLERELDIVRFSVSKVI
jgi:hypothetical protein